MAGCLLIHGFGGSLFEMEPLIAPLKEAGLVVRGIQLPGHGGDSLPFEKSFFNDWLNAAECAYLDLAAQVERVFVIGFSMGGTLALALAARHQPAGLICISAPVHTLRLFPWPVRNLRLYAASLLAHLSRLLQSEAQKKKRGGKGSGTA